MKSTKVFFPGLNSLRFFAALAVFFTHVELMKKFTGFGSHWVDMGERIQSTAFESIRAKEVSWLSPMIANSGSLGVVFFFVLSGFLITYLLLTEKKTSGTIAVKKFYWRRILRIWPLYYLIFILGFFILPNIPWFNVIVQEKDFKAHFIGNMIAFALFLPNLAFALYTTAVPNIGQSWSIGVEEQFYIIWPLIIKFLKRTVRAVILFTLGLLLFKMIVILSLRFYSPEWLQVIKRLLAMSKIECMSLGGIGAWLLFENRTNWLKWVYHPVAQVSSVVIIPLLIMFAPMALQDGLHIIYGTSFLIIILNAASNPDTFFRIEFRPLDFLGRISYGFYMYHVMIIGFTIHLLDYFFQLDRDLSALQNIAVYVISFLFTVIVSSFSYYFFESPFIRLKKKVTTVVSSDV
ncbi:MAG: acyltransferase [Crocinitomicaceae bacterium]|nr:acyltransferase [Crocinitomicaceae bacterium]